MPFARVVSFEDVDAGHMAQMQSEMAGGGPPDDVPAKEIVVLHDAEGKKSVVILFFENEEDYRRGDAALNAMPADETPGRRTSAEKYEVAFRMND